MIQIYGLIGYPLSHSFSAQFFKKKFTLEKIEDCVYQNFEISSIKDFPTLLKNTAHLKGLNVTIPYKEQIIPYLDELSDEAKAIGAVNTIKILHNNGKPHLIGHNTDCYGFKESLKPLLRNYHQKALILGTGGAAKAVEYVLKQIGLEVIYVSRTPKDNNTLAYEDLTGDVFSKFKVIVNSSPLGMYPNIEDAPAIPYHSLNSENLLYDLVYNPLETKFLSLGKSQGALTQNGLAMLHYQAEKAWEIWNQ